MPAKLYDWDHWFSQRRFSLVRGRDFDCSPSSIVQQIRNESSRRGLSATVINDGRRIEVIVLYEGRAKCHRSR